MANTQNIPNHLVWAILSTLFCCLPFGIVSIVYASKVDGLAMAGDLAGAQAASNDAKKWAMIAAGVSIGLMVLYLLFFVVMGVGAGLSGM